MSITLTESAARHVKGMLASRGKGEGLRLGLTRSGCSGYAYVIDFADSVGGDDRVFESNGVRVIVDEGSLPYLDGTEVDYVREGLNSLFKFNNPNVASSCGCGESVGF
jgi:iron-sulfur cluster assembly protein